MTEGQLHNESAQVLLRVREEFLRLRAVSDLQAVMSTPQGRRFVWGLIDESGAFAPSYQSEPHATSYNEGRRAVGLGLLVRCQSEATDLYVTALTESLAELRADASHRAAAKAVPQQETA